MKFFWSQNCLCDYRQINTLWCPQPVRPAGTGNDATHAALTLTGPREATASLTRKMLSISLAGWLCLVIVMLARLWHLCKTGGKCLSNHQPALFEFSSTLIDSSWRIIIKRMKSFPDPKCHGWSRSLAASHSAEDKSCRRSHSISYQPPALWLLCLYSEVKSHGFSHSCGEGLVLGHVLSQTSTTHRPSAQEVELISMSENSSTLGHIVIFFLWLSQRLLNPSTLIDPSLSFSRSSPTVTLLETI